jgi:hypothetical protein
MTGGVLLPRELEPPLTGYRIWISNADGWLRSMVMRNVIWEPGQVTPAAKCNRWTSAMLDGGPAPHIADHPCGWHFYDTYARLAEQGGQTCDTYFHGHPNILLVQVWGIIEVGGRVQRHAMGGRAQYARPVALIKRQVSTHPGYGRVQAAEYAAARRYRLPLLPPEEVV